MLGNLPLDKAQKVETRELRKNFSDMHAAAALADLSQLRFAHQVCTALLMVHALGLLGASEMSPNCFWAFVVFETTPVITILL